MTDLLATIRLTDWRIIRAALEHPWPAPACRIDAILDRPASARAAAERWGIDRRAAARVLSSIPDALATLPGVEAPASAVRRVEHVGDVIDGLDGYDRIVEHWRAESGTKAGPVRGSVRGRRLVAAIRSHGEATIRDVITWWARSPHPRAVFLRREGYGLDTLAGKVEVYADLASVGPRHARRGGAVEREDEAPPLVAEIQAASMGDVEGAW